MAKWINRVVIGSTGTGSPTEAYNPNSGTVLSGTNFVPTAGRFLAVIIVGPVTSTTPSGWTLPSLSSAVNNNGLYFWYRTAAGSDTITTTHNGDGTYPTIVEFLEFPAGTTFVGGNFINNESSSNSVNPVVSGLTGTNLHIGAIAYPANAGNVWSWAVGTEDSDVAAGTTNPKWVELTTGYAEDSTASSTSLTAGRTPTGTTSERITVVIKVAASTPTVTAAFTGTGTLSATVVPRVAVTAAFSGTGTLSATVVPRVAVAANFTGTGTLAAPVVPRFAVTAAFGGTGVLAAAVVPRVAVAANFTGTGTLAAVAVATPTLRLLGGASVQYQVESVAADFTGTGALSASVVPRLAVTADFTGSGVLSAVVQAVELGAVTAAFTGTGTLSALVAVSVTADFTGSGELSASVAGSSGVMAAFGGTGTLTASVSVIAAVTANFTGTGTLSALVALPGVDVNVVIGAPQRARLEIGPPVGNRVVVGAASGAPLTVGEGRF